MEIVSFWPVSNASSCRTVRLYQRKSVNAFCWTKKKFLSWNEILNIFFWRLVNEIRKQTWAENRDGPWTVAKQFKRTLNTHGENLFCPVLLWICARTEKAKTMYIQDVRICIFDFDKPKNRTSSSFSLP